LAFRTDIGPISEGHALVIPKYHGAKLHDVPDEHLTELLPVAKKIAIATGADQYNILQNNGRMAHQMVDHVHCKCRLSIRALGAAAQSNSLLHLDD
jgi:diadenosine tetraphosphate (Ap4A) HIT family hydrolase